MQLVPVYKVYKMKQSRSCLSVHCRVYIIAEAFTAALGIEPHLMTFDADEMKKYLEQCFEDEKPTPFPLPKKPVHY